VLTAAFIAGCDDAPAPQAAPPPPPVTVAKPVVQDIIELDEFTGRFEAIAAVDLRARVGGYLQSVHFTDGAIVKEGDLLFVIDPRPFQVALNQAEAALNAVRTRLDLARIELDRVERLIRTGVAAERTLDERRQQFHAAQAELAGARAAIDQAKLDLGFSEIRAPIAGRIGRKLVSEGNLVSANDTLLTTIVALDPIYFYFDVDERSYLAYLRMSRDGTRPLGRTDGYDVSVILTDEQAPSRQGRVDFVDNRLDPATGTMRGRAVFDNFDFFLTPGMFGRLAIPGSPLYKAVLVPDEAIVADLERRFVYVVAADGTVSQQIIRPGPRHDGYRIVRRGLTGDETIIVSGVQRARFSGKVTAKPIALPPTREGSQTTTAPN
jgi:RND family efflux transporter MFP subunit